MIHKIISKKWRKKAVALMLATTMVGSSLQGIFDTNVAYAAETNTGDVYYDGTYTGTGTGYKGGTTVVKVTVKGDKITDIEEVSNEDTLHASEWSGILFLCSLPKKIRNFSSER